jgi:hypothetical protein
MEEAYNEDLSFKASNRKAILVIQGPCHNLVSIRI